MRKIRLFSVLSVFGITALACNFGATLSPSSTNLPAIPAGIVLETQAAPLDGSTTPEAVAKGPKEETIFIAAPAANSIISSPVSISGEADSTFEQNLVLIISDADGKQISLKVATIQAPLGKRGAFSASLEFAVGSEQPGRISVYSVSAMTGGIEHLSSVEVTLIPSGSASIISTSVEAESIGILAPQALDTVSGGSVEVSGFSDYYFESSLGLALCGGGASGDSDELCGTNGNILALGSAIINAPDAGLPGPFTGNLSYSVSSASSGRIVVYATSARDGGLIHLNSIPVLIKP